MVEPHSSDCRVITTNFLCVRILRKFTVYKTKFFTHNLVIENFITYLKRKFHNEKYISFINNKFDKFMGKWSTLYQFFQGTNNNENIKITKKQQQQNKNKRIIT